MNLLAPKNCTQFNWIGSFCWEYKNICMKGELDFLHPNFFAFSAGDCSIAKLRTQHQSFGTSKLVEGATKHKICTITFEDHLSVGVPW